MLHTVRVGPTTWTGLTVSFNIWTTFYSRYASLVGSTPEINLNFSSFTVGKDPCTPGMTWSHVLTRDGAPCVDSIEQLYFVDQNMIGTLPDCFTPLEDLVSLDFTIEGGLNGNIPTSLFSLPLLQEVTFHDIPLKGSIPSSNRNRACTVSNCADNS